MPDELWKRSLDESTKRFKDRLLSLADFRAALSHALSTEDCPVHAALLRIDRQEPFTAITIGSRGDGSFTHMMSEDLDRSTTFRLETWRRPGTPGTDAEQFNHHVFELTDAFWKADLRSAVSRLISRPNAERRQLIDKTILDLLGEHKIVTLFYTDIDNLKRINTILLHDAADQVIRTLAALLEEAFSPNGIVFHRSGDEFAVLLPGGDSNQALDAARRFMVSLAAHDFDPRINPVGSKMGITFVRNSDLEPTYANFEPKTEKATVASDGSVYRGRARFYVDAPEAYPSTNPQSFSIAFCIAKTGVAIAAPFSSPWLNLLSAEAYKVASLDGANAANLQGPIDKLLDWIGGTLNGRIMTAAASTNVPTLAPDFSRLDVALAICHGVMRSYLNIAPAPLLSIQFNDAFDTFRLVSDQQGEIFVSGADNATPKTYDLGTAPFSTAEAHDRLLSPAILMRIGNDDLGLESLFADVITIDDRPTEGGGLPDFWEAALARLISKVNGDQAVSDVFVIGNKQHAKETIARLQAIDTWQGSLAALSYKTGKSQQDIQNCAMRLSGHIHYAESVPMLLEGFVDVLKTPHTFGEQDHRRTDEGDAFVLQRELPSSSYALRREDGVRVETIARAYPIVLEIVRRAVSEGFTVDQAQMPLQELLDFKVTLSQPTTQMCPMFYSTERASLEDYFNRVFVEPKGLFRSRLEEHGQLEKVIEHVAGIIAGPEEERYNTRRAILIVPHEIIPSKDIAPIGLVSARIIPRFARTKTILHFSYSWRTVEAIVGFPYSIYASVRFSEHLAGLITDKLGANQSRGVELGAVTYIAHSLHFFLNTYAQSIARHIVNEASS